MTAASTSLGVTVVSPPPSLHCILCCKLLSLTFFLAFSTGPLLISLAMAKSILFLFKSSMGTYPWSVPTSTIDLTPVIKSLINFNLLLIIIFSPNTLII